MTTHHVAVLVGSLRKDSFNRKMALALAAIAPPALRLTIVEIGQLPLYNQDDEASPTPAVTAFKDAIRACDALLFVTPEYNRSIPGALKNALDIGSRPYGQGVFSGKPGAVVSVSPGAIGGFGANHHLRQALTFLNVPTLQQPEMYVGGAADLFDEAGGFKKPETQDFMSKFLTAFETWIDRNRAS